MLFIWLLSIPVTKNSIYVMNFPPWICLPVSLIFPLVCWQYMTMVNGTATTDQTQICVTVAINHSHMDISGANINKTIKWLNYYVNLQRWYVSWGQMFLKKYIKTQIYWTLGHGSTLLNVSSLRKKAIAY